MYSKVGTVTWIFVQLTMFLLVDVDLSDVHVDKVLPTTVSIRGIQVLTDDPNDVDTDDRQNLNA